MSDKTSTPESRTAVGIRKEIQENLADRLGIHKRWIRLESTSYGVKVTLDRYCGRSTDSVAGLLLAILPWPYRWIKVEYELPPVEWHRMTEGYDV